VLATLAVGDNGARHMGQRRRRRLPPYPDQEQALWPLGLRPWHRDTVLIAFSLGGLAYEIMFGGGSPAVLTALGALLVSPLALRVDKRRRDTECPEVEIPDPMSTSGDPYG
jgi:hypothetical protein